MNIKSASPYKGGLSPHVQGFSRVFLLFVVFFSCVVSSRSYLLRHLGVNRAGGTLFFSSITTLSKLHIIDILVFKALMVRVSILVPHVGGPLLLIFINWDLFK